MDIFSIYFILQFTPLWFVFSEGEGVRVPATSYLVPLFTLIYLVLFHLLLPSYLDVPCYLNNRQRYCSVWPERDWTPYMPQGGLPGNAYASYSYMSASEVEDVDVMFNHAEVESLRELCRHH